MMRYFLLIFVFLGVVVVGLAGFRGGLSRRPPLEVFPDMDRQPKLRPQTHNEFFGDQLSSQLPVEGTVARGATWQDTAENTGRVPGTTNFVETMPARLTVGMIERGRQRYDIYCGVCHGAAGDGKGVTMKYGMVGMANFHDKRLIQMADGELFNTVTHGKNLMMGYAAAIDIPDRWAIIAYVRALQRSRLAKIEDVPETARGGLTP